MNTVLVEESYKTHPFHYHNFWPHYQKSTELISKTWQTPVVGTLMYQVAKKLKSVKCELKAWAKQHFGNFHEKVTKNEDKIKYVEGKLLDNPSNYRLNSCMVHP